MQVGDKVEWTHVSTRGRTMSMSLREGTIWDIKGDTATVMLKSKRLQDVSLVRLRTVGQESQIGEFVRAMRDAHRS